MTEEQENSLNFGPDEKVGSYLRRVREFHGLELEQLAKSIRLGKNILEAIEGNQWNTFPTEAYLRSYIASISEKLSLDKNEILRRFSSEINSQFGITQKNIVHKQAADASAHNNIPVAAIVIIMLVIVGLFFLTRLLDDSTETKSVSGAEEVAEVYAEAEPDTEEADSFASDSTDAAQQAEAAVPAIDTNAVDTLRFECSPSATDPTCGATHKGHDIKMYYFRNRTDRYVRRGDTAQIVVTVPERTKLLINGVRTDYGKFNTLFFYNGQIVEKKNRDLR